MVINRLCDPDSKPGVLRWLKTVGLPGIVPEVIGRPNGAASSMRRVPAARATGANCPTAALAPASAMRSAMPT